MLKGNLTYIGIVVTALAGLFGVTIPESEATEIATAIVMLVSSCAAIYGRARIKKAEYYDEQ